MKKNILIVIVNWAMICAAQLFAQAPMKTLEENGKKPVSKIDTAAVPKEVRAARYGEYPAVTYDEWYGYSNYSDESWWYDNDSLTYISTGAPEYYVTEFVVKETPHKVIYSKSGKKIATHRKTKNTPHPAKVSDAFKTSKYKSWKEIGDKVEIYNDGNKTRIYKLTVANGSETRVLFYDEQGKLIKDKKIN